MRTSDKKLPAYNDLDRMPFGKFKGYLLQDVPANYLAYLKYNGGTNDQLLNNYIHNSWDAIKQEINER